jgi:hypothetical protein
MHSGAAAAASGALAVRPLNTALWCDDGSSRQHAAAAGQPLGIHHALERSTGVLRRCGMGLRSLAGHAAARHQQPMRVATAAPEHQRRAHSGCYNSS